MSALKLKITFDFPLVTDFVHKFVIILKFQSSDKILNVNYHKGKFHQSFTV